jgi:hypothetical protein
VKKEKGILGKDQELENIRLEKEKLRRELLEIERLENLEKKNLEKKQKQFSDINMRFNFDNKGKKMNNFFEKTKKRHFDNGFDDSEDFGEYESLPYWSNNNNNNNNYNNNSDHTRKRKYNRTDDCYRY